MRAATAKPPPPVPPRPSKTVIAEALAKTKKIVTENAPQRVAPPPPPPVALAQRNSLNVVVKPQFDRSISEEIKPSNTRTVVFQSSDMIKCSSKVHVKNEDDVNDDDDEKKANNSVDDRNHVNTLIDEMFASVLEIPDDPPNGAVAETVNSTVLVVEPPSSDDGNKSNSSTEERKRVKFDDKKNHELLISELESMKKEQQRILKRQRKPSQEIYEHQDESSEIHHSDWVEVNDGEEVRLSSCQITIDTAAKKKNNIDSTNGDIISRLSSMSSLHGLPPLPKSLSGFSLLEDEEDDDRLLMSNGSDAASGKITSNLDTQLAILRREMVSVCIIFWFVD